MSNPAIPTADQLAETRNKLWHQSGDAILTLEGLRAWINQAGLVLFAPRSQQLPAPAPSVVEAVLGTVNPTPTLADSEQARVLTARLIAEGSAVPLNLLATPNNTSSTPDYLCSSAVFSYIFTLRGDKAWKQPPATTGAVKVSPLALAAYEALAARVTLSAAELATELGKEVTEAAVLRALSELWSHLRVLPIPQQDNTVLWELMSTRFTKQIKAGSNAGQPSALSALISLYLGMAVVATEEEIETSLSPVAPRSRIRDIVHALMSARQLEAIAIDGRTVLHISGDLPAFTSVIEGPTEEPLEVEASATATDEATDQTTDPASRITKFIAKPRKTGTGFATRFTPRPGTGRPALDRERRPFDKKPYEKKPFNSTRPTFSKPWDETRPSRPAAEGSTGAPTRPTFRDKPTFRKEGGTRPTFRRDEGAPPRRDFTPRPDGPRSAPRSFDRPAGDDQRPPRKTFSKPGTFGRKREDAAGGRPAYGGSDSRPRRDFNASAASSRPSYGGDRPQRSSEGRPSSGSGGAERRPGSYTPRPPSEGFAGRKPFAPREGGSSYPRKPFTPGRRPPHSPILFPRPRLRRRLRSPPQGLPQIRRPPLRQAPPVRGPPCPPGRQLQQTRRLPQLQTPKPPRLQASRHLRQVRRRQQALPQTRPWRQEVHPPPLRPHRSLPQAQG